MGYALQWFAFALILCIGYVIYVRRQSQRQSVQVDEVLPEV
jgi:cytochrome oxidase assembly protein ShyY1